MERITADQWMKRCTAELRKHIQDECVADEDLAQCASEMLEEPRYRNLEPEAAGALWARDYA